MDINNLFGTWGLDRFWFTDDAGVEVDPLGRTPVGNLILGHDTHYAFTMMRGNRSIYQNGDLLGGTSAEKIEAAEGYVSFGGSWSLDNSIISFAVTYSLFPNWVGEKQQRRVNIENGVLLLQTLGPILMAGKMHRGAARWSKL